MRNSSLNTLPVISPVCINTIFSKHIYSSTSLFTVYQLHFVYQSIQDVGLTLDRSDSPRHRHPKFPLFPHRQCHPPKPKPLNIPSPAKISQSTDARAATGTSTPPNTTTQSTTYQSTYGTRCAVLILSPPPLSLEHTPFNLPLGPRIRQIPRRLPTHLRPRPRRDRTPNRRDFSLGLLHAQPEGSEAVLYGAVSERWGDF